ELQNCRSSRPLRRASDTLLRVDSPSTSVSSEGSVESQSMLHSVALIDARNMMDRSRHGGTFRRLGSNERLRSQIPRGGTKGKSKRAVQRKGIKEKPFEFALLNSKEDDTEDDFLKKEMVVERGMFTLSEQDCEAQVREKIASTLKEKYSVIGPNDFEFVKATQKRITDNPGISALHNSHVQQEEEQKTESPYEFFSRVVNEFPEDIMEPTEMLRYLQKKIVSGRPLEVTNSSRILEGETNFITVDRNNILETTFEELKHVADPRVTFEVQFYGEQAVDSGGPRKEWIRLCNQKIKDIYFDNGLKEHMSEDYYYIGQMVCIALLQNGQLPVYRPEEILQAIFVEDLELPSCVRELKEFSEEGSNMLIHETAIYSKFVKYVRDVSSGCRVVTLGNILEFVTGTSEEPPLGFAKTPQIHFPVAEGTGQSEEPPQKKKPIWHFVPTCHTCSNTLDLTRENAVLHLPSDNEPFKLYDLAFKNSYFGVM
ncbi:unnamed protein product, partial [Pocillopora meandrina]